MIFFVVALTGTLTQENRAFITEKTHQLEAERERLGAMWQSKQEFFYQCLEFQLFMRDAEQADTWITKQESFLANDNLGESLDDVEALLKKHEDFEKSLAAQEEKAKYLEDSADKLVAQEPQNYAAQEIAQKRDYLRERRALM